jgi:hypothetical protein
MSCLKRWVYRSLTLPSSDGLTFGTGVLHLIPTYHQPEATIFQFIILKFVYSSTCFGRFPAHHQELIDCNGSLWFYLRIVVTVVLCSWSGRPARPRLGAAVNSITPDMLQRVWSELDYRIDVCRVTRRGHVECVLYHMKLYEFVQQ